MFFNNTNKEDVFIFLDNLRKSGDINMYAAATDIMNEFGFSKPEAKKALKSWISEYKE